MSTNADMDDLQVDERPWADLPNPALRVSSVQCAVCSLHSSIQGCCSMMMQQPRHDRFDRGDCISVMFIVLVISQSWLYRLFVWHPWLAGNRPCSGHQLLPLSSTGVRCMVRGHLSLD